MNLLWQNVGWQGAWNDDVLPILLLAEDCLFNGVLLPASSL